MNMIERVARVLNGDGKGGWKWEYSGYRLQQMELEDARRVIAAMRKPTEEMIEYANLNHPLRKGQWEGLIDLILESDAALEPPIGLENADDQGIAAGAESITL